MLKERIGNSHVLEVGKRKPEPEALPYLRTQQEGKVLSEEALTGRNDLPQEEHLTTKKLS